MQPEDKEIFMTDQQQNALRKELQEFIDSTGKIVATTTIGRARTSTRTLLVSATYLSTLFTASL